ncbi:MAG: NAD(P)H-hydrate dehydratase, partial [Methylophilaceae bacterium]|nr:NAD(P)H-hydrate dehydratase [Methylophilaceae bacterium]
LAAAGLARDLAEAGFPILVLAGPGNNGGDALVAARHLKQSWHRVDVVFTGAPDRLPPDARAALDAWRTGGGEILTTLPAGRQYGLIIDGLFGIGLTRPLTDTFPRLIDQINALPCPRLALDVPSGLCADTGRVLGAAVRADHTLTLLGAKPGLYTLEGPDHAGVVHLTDLGVDTATLADPQGWLVDAPPELPAPRRRNSHKGSHGSVGIAGGDTAMTGAALLAARAALLAGAGRVYTGLLAEHAPALDCGQPELMLRDARTLLDLNHLTALVAGPGMGRSAHAEAVLARALHYPAPLLLDADALGLLAEHAGLRHEFQQRSHGAVLTPHPGEAAALLACSTAEIQADRVAAATRIARDYRAITVLKGCGSITATPDGRWFVNASGNPGLASAGMGDILCGLIAALIAQGMPLLEATLLGVHLHGAAADALVADGVGPVGLTASEVALEARRLLNTWMHAPAAE